MRVAILGPLEVEGPAGPIAISPGKQRSILALLALRSGAVVARDKLVDELWGESPPPNAVKALQVHIGQLRRALGDESACLVTRAPGYVLDLDHDELDLHRLEAALADARRALESGDPARAREHAITALTQWRGAPFADLDAERSLHDAVPRIEELRVASQELAIEAALQLGDHAEVLPELEALVREHPLREHLRGRLMLCLYRCGRQAEALEAYQAARNALVEELGIEPSPQLRELQQAILSQDPGLDPVPVPVSKRAATPARAGFIGRERELAELAGALDDAIAGSGRLCFVAGEPGIGKSRLVEELLVLARERGARVVVGRCWEAGGAPAYWPWVQALRAYTRETDPDVLRGQLGEAAATLAQIVPEVRVALPDLNELPPLDSAGARFRLFDATSAFLRAASALRPIVIAIDDLHAADASSLLLLQFLSREVATTHLLLVAAYRDVDPLMGAELTELLAAVAGEPASRRLHLTGLSAGELARYVELTAAHVASPEVLDALQEQTDGNPLFAGEFVRLIAAEGLQSGGDVRLAIPTSVQDVIARRLARLSAECDRALILASVLGREFALDALAHLAGVAEEDLLDTLDEAMAARLVTDVPGRVDRLRFAHALIRDALYTTLTTARRVRFHRLVVDALEALYGEDPGPHLAELAHHAVAGRDPGRGLDYARRAGDRARALLAYEEAARLYRTALQALDHASSPDDHERCELLLSLGDAEDCAGDRATAKTLFLDAAAIARGLGLHCELARAAAGYGGQLVWARSGEDERLVPLLEDGLAALEDVDEVELRARLLSRLAGALRDEHSRDRRDRLSAEAVELARRTGNPAALAYALNGRNAAIVAPDTIDECLVLSSELCEVAERIGDRPRLMQGLSNRTMVYLLRGDVAAAEADLSVGRRIGEELGQSVHLWLVGGEQAMLALALGRLDEAEELITWAYSHGRHAQGREADAVHAIQRATLSDFRGGLADVEPAIAEVAARSPARPVFRCVLGYVQARVGRWDDARRVLDELAEDRFSALPFDQEWIFAVSFLAETCALVEDAASAPVLYELLLPWAALSAVDHAEGIRGSVARYLGLLATTMHRWDDADQHFEAAEAMNARMGALPWLALTQADHARMLLARDAPGDRARSGELLVAARSTFTELGMRWRDT